VILLREPAASQGQATGERSHAPELRLAAFGSQAIQSEDQAALSLGDLRQTVPVLPLVAGQERQLHLLIQIAHMGHGDADVRRQLGMNLAGGGVVVRAPPAHAHKDIVAIGRVRKGNTLRCGGPQAQA